MIAIDNILLPYSLTADDLGWCNSGEVDFLLGADNNRFLVRDDPRYKGVAKPANLRFLRSPLLRGPIAFGLLTGRSKLKVINLSQSPSPEMKQRVIPWIQKLVKFKK